MKIVFGPSYFIFDIVASVSYSKSHFFRIYCSFSSRFHNYWTILTHCWFLQIFGGPGASEALSRNPDSRINCCLETLLHDLGIPSSARWSYLRGCWQLFAIYQPTRSWNFHSLEFMNFSTNSILKPDSHIWASSWIMAENWNRPSFWETILLMNFLTLPDWATGLRLYASGNGWCSLWSTFHFSIVSGFAYVHLLSTFLRNSLVLCFWVWRELCCGLERMSFNSLLFELSLWCHVGCFYARIDLTQKPINPNS